MFLSWPYISYLKTNVARTVNFWRTLPIKVSKKSTDSKSVDSGIHNELQRSRKLTIEVCDENNVIEISKSHLRIAFNSANTFEIKRAKIALITERRRCFEPDCNAIVERDCLPRIFRHGDTCVDCSNEVVTLLISGYQPAAGSSVCNSSPTSCLRVPRLHVHRAREQREMNEA